MSLTFGVETAVAIVTLSYLSRWSGCEFAGGEQPFTGGTTGRGGRGVRGAGERRDGYCPAKQRPTGQAAGEGTLSAASGFHLTQAGACSRVRVRFLSRSLGSEVTSPSSAFLPHRRRRQRWRAAGRRCTASRPPAGMSPPRSPAPPTLPLPREQKREWGREAASPTDDVTYANRYSGGEKLASRENTRLRWCAVFFQYLHLVELIVPG